MIGKDLNEYSREELENEIRSRNKKLADLQKKAESLNYNFGISDKDFDNLVKNTEDVNWTESAIAPWFVIYENNERYVCGQSEQNMDEVKMLIDEIIRQEMDVLYILKKGKMVKFSIEIVIDIKE